MNITVEKITGFDLINRACEFTSGNAVDINPGKMYKCEHSPIRTQLFAIYMRDIPTYVSTHFVRHKIGVEHFVKSNRGAKETIDRNTPVNHMMFLNAQALVAMARARLCNKADEITQHVMFCIVGELTLADRYLAEHLVPNCLYRGHCPEIKQCDKPPEWPW